MADPHPEVAIIINVIILSIIIHNYHHHHHCRLSPSSCAAELEVGAKEKKFFCTEIYFLWRICKKRKERNKLLNMLYFL